MESLSFLTMSTFLGRSGESRECSVNGGLSWRKVRRGGMYWCVRNNVAASSELPSLFLDKSKRAEDPTSLITSPNGESHHKGIGLDANVLCPDQEGIGIVRFLKEKSFFITGATGFLAKVLIEKILRTAPDVGKIFVLIKARNKEHAEERLNNEIVNTELFKCLQAAHGASYPAFMQRKLVPVVGNVTEANLGLKPDVAAEIAEEVDVIINSAANTTFDERYDLALNINTLGPSRLVNLAKGCKKLRLFLHVSTAYVNGQRQGRVMEKAFCKGDSIASERFTNDPSSTSHPPLDIENEINLASNSESKSGDIEATQKMKDLGLERARMYGWQDTYAFTKAMGEMLIENMRGDVPVVVVRPSVIESTFQDPFPGWMEGNRMMDPVILQYGKGQLTGFLVDPNGVLDVVPADMVVNATLAAMAKHGREGKAGMNIYHVASSVINPLVFQDLAQLLHQHFTFCPHIDSRGGFIQVPEIKLFRSMDEFSSHVLAEARAAMAAAPHKFSQSLHKISKKAIDQAKYLANIYAPYTFYAGRFDNSNTQKLLELMSEEEKQKFGFDVGSIDWNDYILNVHIPGLRRHVMKGRGM